MNTATAPKEVSEQIDTLLCLAMKRSGTNAFMQFAFDLTGVMELSITRFLTEPNGPNDEMMMHVCQMAYTMLASIRSDMSGRLDRQERYGRQDVDKVTRERFINIFNLFHNSGQLTTMEQSELTTRIEEEVLKLAHGPYADIFGTMPE